MYCGTHSKQNQASSIHHMYTHHHYTHTDDVKDIAIMRSCAIYSSSLMMHAWYTHLQASDIELGKSLIQPYLGTLNCSTELSDLEL